MKTIKDIVKGIVILDIDDLEEFQGNLKDLTEENYNRLKNEILADGFAAPPFVWKNPKGQYCILDAHQRKRVLVKMREAGIKIPKINCIEIAAKDRNHAKRLVLAYTSQYGTMTKQGLYEFLNTSDISFADAVAIFRFPEIDFGNMALENNEGLSHDMEKNQDEKKKNYTKMQCPSCGYEF